MYNIKEEKMLFYNDLKEYQYSIEGKKLDYAFKNNLTNELEKLIQDYYTNRNNDTLHYETEQEKLLGIEQDNRLMQYYREQD